MAIPSRRAHSLPPSPFLDWRRLAAAFSHTSTFLVPLPAKPNPYRMLESTPMHPAIPQLLELQRLDQIIASSRAELDSLPKQLREADAKLNGARAAVTAAKEAHTQALTQRKKLELDVEQWKGRAKKYREQSSSVKTNEAYKALQHEIATAEGEASKAEDQVLEQMMALEEVERRMKHVAADLRESEQAIAAEKKQMQVQYGNKKKKLEAATTEREQIAKKVPQDVLDLYTRVEKRHPASALAEARGEQCRACGMRVLPHVVQMLASETDEEVFRCEMCGRILYSLEPMPHAMPNETANGAANS
jgi:predicted  nucleic acid-binding Zn-ribbon protein